MSKRYTVAHVRERLSDALDEAERGVPVYIERRGTRFRLSLAAEALPRRTRRTPKIELIDPAVGEGRWTWIWSARGLGFKPRKRR